MKIVQVHVFLVGGAVDSWLVRSTPGLGSRPGRGHCVHGQDT